MFVTLCGVETGPDAMRRYRQLRGTNGRPMSQGVLARLVGLSDTAISQIERGINEPRRENVRMIDAVLDANGEILAAFAMSADTGTSSLQSQIDRLREQVAELSDALDAVHSEHETRLDALERSILRRNLRDGS